MKLPLKWKQCNNDFPAILGIFCDSDNQAYCSYYLDFKCLRTEVVPHTLLIERARQVGIIDVDRSTISILLEKLCAGFYESEPELIDGSVVIKLAHPPWTFTMEKSSDSGSDVDPLAQLALLQIANHSFLLSRLEALTAAVTERDSAIRRLRETLRETLGTAGNVQVLRVKSPEPVLGISQVVAAAIGDVRTWETCRASLLRPVSDEQSHKERDSPRKKLFYTSPIKKQVPRTKPGDIITLTALKTDLELELAREKPHALHPLVESSDSGKTDIDTDSSTDAIDLASGVSYQKRTLRSLSTTILVAQSELKSEIDPSTDTPTNDSNLLQRRGSPQKRRQKFGMAVLARKRR